ncbi:MAG: hypothetical protein JRM77_06960 [Nitrososphaerota archaeon]|nr:hypothetical protein [Nitrososphaerota archaeon]
MRAVIETEAYQERVAQIRAYYGRLKTGDPEHDYGVEVAMEDSLADWKEEAEVIL